MRTLFQSYCSNLVLFANYLSRRYKFHISANVGVQKIQKRLDSRLRGNDKCFPSETF